MMGCSGNSRLPTQQAHPPGHSRESGNLRLRSLQHAQKTEFPAFAWMTSCTELDREPAQFAHHRERIRIHVQRRKALGQLHRELGRRSRAGRASASTASAPWPATVLASLAPTCGWLASTASGSASATSPAAATISLICIFGTSEPGATQRACCPLLAPPSAEPALNPSFMFGLAASARLAALWPPAASGTPPAPAARSSPW
jgi:hypothetical protein